MVDPIPFPMITHRNVAAEIKKLAKNSSRVIVTEHCAVRMLERGISRAHVHRCLQRGNETDYEFDHEHGTHNVTLSLRTAGSWVGVVAALLENDGGWVVAVTTFIQD